MGSSPSLLTGEPWRICEVWDQRQKMKDQIQSFLPKIDGDKNVSKYKIILTGTVGAGKSSLFNSFNSIFTERLVTSRSASGEASSSVTSTYFEHNMYDGDRNQLAFKICDTMGLTKQMGEVDVDNIVAAMSGHVPHEHQFTHGKRFEVSSKGYIENPSIADMAHCVAFVVNATTTGGIPEEVWKMLGYLWKELNKQKVPMFIILTHIDEKCPKVEENVKNVYRSIVVRDLVQLVSSKLCGIPGAQIFPVVNYKDQVILEDDMDVLLLFALRQMLYAAQANLDNR